MSASDVEGKLKLQAASPKKQTQLKTIVFNFIFSIVVIFFINQALKVNILSSFTGITVPGEYFRCGWDTYDTKYYDAPSDTELTEKETWSKVYIRCISSKNHSYYCIRCSSYSNPQKSGVLWYSFNVVSIVSLAISAVSYIFIFVATNCLKLKDKYPSILQKLSFITILFQSFVPTISLLVVIISWFAANGHSPGCWRSEYIFYSNNVWEHRFVDRKMGKSMIFDIVAAALCGIHLMVYINTLCIYLGFGNKKKRIRKKKHGAANQPMLFEHNHNINEKVVAVECEGYNNGDQIQYDKQNVNHVRMEVVAAAAIEPGDYQMDDVKPNESECIKKWFFKSVIVAHDYRQIYYDKFIENGFDNFAVIKSISDEDLVHIGVDKLGHRKTILMATQML